MGDHVEFTGLVSSNEILGSILATADVCVSPDEANRMNDISTMNKVLEYMALGKPIVQFDLREGRVSAGGASLYAASNDVTALAKAIIRLLDDPTSDRDGRNRPATAQGQPELGDAGAQPAGGLRAGRGQGGAKPAVMASATRLHRG